MHSAASLKNTYRFEANCTTDGKATPKHATSNNIMKLIQLLQHKNEY